MDVLSSVFVTCDFSVLSFEFCFEFSILCCVLCHFKKCDKGHTRIPRKVSSHLLAQKSQEPQSECGY